MSLKGRMITKLSVTASLTVLLFIFYSFVGFGVKSNGVSSNIALIRFGDNGLAYHDISTLKTALFSTFYSLMQTLLFAMFVWYLVALCLVIKKGDFVTKKAEIAIDLPLTLVTTLFMLLSVIAIIQFSSATASIKKEAGNTDVSLNGNGIATIIFFVLGMISLVGINFPSFIKRK